MDKDNNFKDFYDSSIFLGLLIEKDDLCKKRIDLIGYKGKNNGIISHLILGEIFTNLFLKLDKDYLRIEAFKVIDSIFDKCIKENRLKIAKIERGDDLYIDDLLEDYQMEYSDARHVSEAIVLRCNIFWTTDKYLNQPHIKSIIKKKYKLLIKHP